MALSILEEICEDEDNITFLLKNVDYLPDAPSSSQYMMQYLMTEEGFHYLLSKNCIQEQLEVWMN
jgi:Rapamycin-insensitive companion of mTOR RasGEF_N domain